MKFEEEMEEYNRENEGQRDIVTMVFIAAISIAIGLMAAAVTILVLQATFG